MYQEGDSRSYANSILNYLRNCHIVFPAATWTACTKVPIAPLPRHYLFFYLKKFLGVPIVVQQKWIQLGTTRLWVQSLALLGGLRIRRCYDLWCRQQTWLRSGIARPAAVPLIWPLAWETPYAVGVALKKKNL